MVILKQKHGRKKCIGTESKDQLNHIGREKYEGTNGVCRTPFLNDRIINQLYINLRVWYTSRIYLSQVLYIHIIGNRSSSNVILNPLF